jgi:tetratricopeptide (TPR) repeat protein
MAQKLWQEGFRLYDPLAVGRLLASAPGDLRQSPEGQLLQAHQASISGDHLRSEALLKPLLTHPDPRVSGAAGVRLAIQHFLTGRDDAVHLAERALELLPDTCTRERAIGLNLIGSQALQELQAGKARQALQAAADQFAADNDLSTCIKVWVNLCIAEALLGHHQESLAIYERIQATCRELNQPPLIPAQIVAAETHAMLGHDAIAASLAESGSTLAKAVNLAVEVAAAQVLRSEWAVRQGNLALAESVIDDVARWCEQSSNALFPWRLHQLRAEIALIRQDVAEAVRQREAAVHLSGFQTDGAAHPELHRLDIRIAVARKKPDDAAECLTRWLEILETVDAPFWRAWALADKACLHDLSGDVALARAARQAGQALCDPEVWQTITRIADQDWSRLNPKFPTQLILTLLDSWSVEQSDGTPLFGPLQGPHSHRLLAILYLHPDGIDSKTLAGYLYPDGPVSRNALAMQASRLRERLEATIGSVTVVHQRGRYRMDGHSRIVSDLGAFNEAWHQWKSASQPDLRKKAALTMIARYRSPLGGSFGSPEWVKRARHEARTRWLQVLQWLLDQWHAKGEHAAALNAVEQAMTIEPEMKALGPLLKRCQHLASQPEGRP